MSKLANRDYYVVIDKSASMNTSDTPTGQSRFEYAKESTIGIAQLLEKHDPDGITLIPFSGGFKVYDNVTSGRVAEVFAENEPFGGTVLAPVLQHIFNDYNSRKANGTTKENGAMVVVVTDGAPSDDKAVGPAIAAFTQTLAGGDDEFGIAFFQVGQDPVASAFLKHLDNSLKNSKSEGGEGAKFDIVDTKTFDEIEQMGLQEALIAALDD